MALKDAADKDRYTETFPGVQRPGVPFSKLSADQKAMVADVVKTISSANSCVGAISGVELLMTP